MCHFNPGVTRRTPTLATLPPRQLKRALAMSLVVLGGGTATQLAHGNEVSLLSGFYRTEEIDNAGANGGKKTTIDLGGRYSDQLNTKLHWYGQANLALRSFGKSAAGVAPANSTSLTLGGGVRHYFGKLGENFATYASAGGSYKSEKDGSYAGVSATTTEKNGLYYGASFGLRLYLGTQFFCDFEAPLFESALFGTELQTVETVGAGGVTNKTEVETKKTELFATTEGAFSKVFISLGMKL